MWSSRPSLWRIDLEFHDNNYIWETCKIKYIDYLQIIIHLITICRHIHTRGRRTRLKPTWECSHWREIKANFVIIGRRNSIRVLIPHKKFSTRQIWGIWKLRPAYSLETPNLGQNRWCFVPWDLEIWWMTLENNRAPLLWCFKLCATFHSHQWIQTGVAVRKRPIWVKFDDF